MRNTIVFILGIWFIGLAFYSIFPTRGFSLQEEYTYTVCRTEPAGPLTELAVAQTTERGYPFTFSTQVDDGCPTEQGPSRFNPLALFLDTLFWLAHAALVVGIWTLFTKLGGRRRWAIGIMTAYSLLMIYKWWGLAFGELTYQDSASGLGIVGMEIALHAPIALYVLYIIRKRQS